MTTDLPDPGKRTNGLHLLTAGAYTSSRAVPAAPAGQTLFGSRRLLNTAADKDL